MFSQTSSLAASDYWPRHEGTGHMKNSSIRMSKQEISEKKMFGSKFGSHGKDMRVGKKFGLNRKVKGMSKGMPKESFSKGTYHAGGVGPSENEFDKMLKSSVTFNPNKKRSMFSQKKFG